MPVEYSYSPSEHTIRVTCYAELTIQDIHRYFEEVAQDERILKGAVELVDLSAVTLFDVDPAGVATMPGSYAPARSRQQIIGTVPFGANRLNLGMIQLIEAYFRKLMPDHTFAIAETLADAREIARRIQKEAGNSEAK